IPVSKTSHTCQIGRIVMRIKLVEISPRMYDVSFLYIIISKMLTNAGCLQNISSPHRLLWHVTQTHPHSGIEACEVNSFFMALRNDFFGVKA
ncbi:MAG: hypothetical protein PHH81_08020, partial [Bacteroides graminisolvens]|nr:hypothetical protein [Bacteroides graminisolvens]